MIYNNGVDGGVSFLWIFPIPRTCVQVSGRTRASNCRGGRRGGAKYVGCVATTRQDVYDDPRGSQTTNEGSGWGCTRYRGMKVAKVFPRGLSSVFRERQCDVKDLLLPQLIGGLFSPRVFYRFIRVSGFHSSNTGHFVFQFSLVFWLNMFIFRRLPRLIFNFMCF